MAETSLLPAEEKVMFEIFQYPFMRYALIGGLLIGAASAYVGIYLILNRIIFVGIALSEIAVLGVILGLMLGIFPSIAAVLLTLIAIFIFWLPVQSVAATRESIIGYGYAAAAAAAILLVAKNPAIESHGLDMISGNLLYVSKNEVFQMGAVFGLVIALLIVFYKEILFSSFDNTTARTLGIKAKLYGLILYVLIGIVISFSMKVAGVLFVFASLVIPPMIALKIFSRLPVIIAASVFASGLCISCGMVLSFKVDLPTGPTIVCIYAVLFMFVAGIVHLNHVFKS